MSWPGAVWILTARKTLQQWAKLLARSACGRSSMTECHSSSQHCDVQSASTSRPWPALKSMRNPEKVRIKQARRMIAATLQKYCARLLFFSLFLHGCLYSRIYSVMWDCWCEPYLVRKLSLSSPCLPLSITRLHRWREDRHLSECLWRHQYHHGCIETVPQGFACSCHLIRRLPQVHRGCKYVTTRQISQKHTCFTQFDFCWQTVVVKLYAVSFIWSRNESHQKTLPAFIHLLLCRKCFTGYNVPDVSWRVLDSM